MPNRIIKESICTSNEIDALKPEEEILFYRIIVNCDDFGRMDARLPILRAKCFPLRIDSVKDKDIRAWMDSLIKQGLIFTYEADGKEYLQMTTWEKHQQIRAKRSKFPAPDDGVIHKIADEINGKHLLSDVPENPIQSNLESESNPNPTSTQSTLKDRFETFWTNYPKKRSKGQAEKAWAKIKPDEQLTGEILSALERAKTSADWQKDGGQFIPYPATWLNAKGWEDDYTPTLTVVPKGWGAIKEFLEDGDDDDED